MVNTKPPPATSQQTSSNQFQLVEFLARQGKPLVSRGKTPPGLPEKFVKDIPSDVVDVVCDLEMLGPGQLDGGMPWWFTRRKLGEDFIHSNTVTRV